MDPFIEELKSTHKVTIYALPLLGLNQASFPDFDNCYINRDGTHLCVEVRTLDAVKSFDVLAHHALKIVVGHEQMIRLWFKVPQVWLEDMALVIKGKYSRISESAKSMIRTYSGLPYRLQDPDGYDVFTDFRLLALDRHPTLRRKWYQLIEPKESFGNIDLINPPGEQEFLEFTQ